MRELESRFDRLNVFPPPPEKKSLGQRILGFLAATSLLSAGIGGAVTIVTKDDLNCTYAHEAIRDDSLNGALSPEQQSAYMQEQLRIARKCGRQD